MASGSPLESACGAGTTIGNVASSSKAPLGQQGTWVVELALVNALRGQRERDSFLEAMGHYSHVAHGEGRPSAREFPLFSWVYVSFRYGMDQVLPHNDQLSFQTSACSEKVPSLTNPHFSPG